MPAPEDIDIAFDAIQQMFVDASRKEFLTVNSSAHEETGAWEEFEQWKLERHVLEILQRATVGCSSQGLAIIWILCCYEMIVPSARFCLRFTLIDINDYPP